MSHQLNSRQGPSTIRTQLRQTSVVVARPARGEARFALACGHCGREGVFVVQDLDTTNQLRRVPIIRSVLLALVFLALPVSFAIIGFGGGDILFQVLTIPAGLIFGPFGLALLIAPTGKIGVEVPEPMFYESNTSRQGFTYVTRNKHAGQGLSCVGRVEVVK
ncbi:hypothetical protein [Streptomyces sp. NBRC 109706]|uniref:hypothetical protein n=1 Tax=Streptomyces sp. NBRC 109706 TaxID=1550035 RepID=UPI0007865C16|nr:hypothetical protein [Streptomyces sp. NBRC 109706]